MTHQDIHTLLNWVDEWIASLADDQLNEECRKTGSDFFAFMERRGVYPGWVAKLIHRATGLHPRQLHRVDDALRLRGWLQNYGYSMVDIYHAEKSGNLNGLSLIEYAMDSAEQHWGLKG